MIEENIQLRDNLENCQIILLNVAVRNLSVITVIKTLHNYQNYSLHYSSHSVYCRGRIKYYFSSKTFFFF